jgi:hypothetical protein
VRVDRVVALIIGAGVFGGSGAYLSSHATRHVQAQVSSSPATIPAGIGSPTANGLACSSGMASSTSASLWVDRSIPSNQNAIYRCVLNTDNTTYAWQAPFTVATPSILGATASFGGAFLAIGGSVSNTAAVAGATVGSNCTATRADGTLLPVGLVIDCGVSTPGIATVRISAPLAGTPPGGVYNVRIIL